VEGSPSELTTVDEAVAADSAVVSEPDAAVVSDTETVVSVVSVPASCAVVAVVHLKILESWYD